MLSIRLSIYAWPVSHETLKVDRWNFRTMPGLWFCYNKKEIKIIIKWNKKQSLTKTENLRYFNPFYAFIQFDACNVQNMYRTLIVWVQLALGCFLSPSDLVTLKWNINLFLVTSYLYVLQLITDVSDMYKGVCYGYKGK